MTGNALRLAGKILILVKLMALAIYAKAGLLGQGQGLCLKAKAKD